MATIVNDGLEYIAKLINGVSTDYFHEMAIGSGTTAEANDQIALVTEMSGGGASRKAATCLYEVSYKTKFDATFTNSSGSSWSINEFGLFNNGNKMMMRHKFASTVTVADGKSVQIIYTQTTARA